MRQASESLAGRITFCELAPFVISEIHPSHADLQEFWLRGGYPLCWLAQSGAEMDIVAEYGKRKIGFEIKFSSAPTLSKGFWSAMNDLKLVRAFVIAPVEADYPLAANIEVIAAARLAEAVCAINASVDH